MSEEKTVSVDIEVLLKQGLNINPDDDLKVIVFSTEEEDAS